MLLLCGNCICFTLPAHTAKWHPQHSPRGTKAPGSPSSCPARACLCPASLPACLPLGWEVCPQGIWVGAHPGAGALLGKGVQPISRPACWGSRVWDAGGQMRWQELYLEGAIWSPPRMLQQAVPRAGPAAACAAPEHQHPPPRPHTALCSFFQPCFSFLRAVKRCSLPVTVPPPSLPPSCWSKPPSWNSPAD